MWSEYWLIKKGFCPSFFAVRFMVAWDVERKKLESLISFPPVISEDRALQLLSDRCFRWKTRHEMNVNEMIEDCLRKSYEEVFGENLDKE